MNIQLIIAFAGPILTALLGAFGIYLQEWRERRDARLARQVARKGPLAREDLHYGADTPRGAEEDGVTEHAVDEDG